MDTLWLVGGGQQECPSRSTSLLGRHPCTDHMASDDPSGTTAREAIMCSEAVLASLCWTGATLSNSQPLITFVQNSLPQAGRAHLA